MSNHPIQHKLGVIRTLYHRAKSVVTDQEDLKAELDYIDKALTQCGYPAWALKCVRDSTFATTTLTSKPQHETRRTIASVTLPYVKGLSESIQRAFYSQGVRVCFKPENKLREQLVAPKDSLGKEEITGAVYHISCHGETRACKENYIGETERSLRARFLEHRRPSCVATSEVAQHIHIESPGHQVDIKDVKVLNRDQRWFERGIKEAIYIRALRPTLNRDQGRHHLPGIWTNTIRSHVLSDM